MALLPSPDAATDALYIAEENVGVWRYGLDPASGAARTLVQPIASAAAAPATARPAPPASSITFLERPSQRGRNP